MEEGVVEGVAGTKVLLLFPDHDSYSHRPQALLMWYDSIEADRNEIWYF